MYFTYVDTVFMAICTAGEDLGSHGLQLPATTWVLGIKAQGLCTSSHLSKAGPVVLRNVLFCVPVYYYVDFEYLFYELMKNIVLLIKLFLCPF